MKNNKILPIMVILGVVLVTWFILTYNKSSTEEKTSSQPSNTLPEIIFMVPKDGVQIKRDYNQMVMIPIRNEGPGIARLRIASGYYKDFPAGFVGRGTPDWEIPNTVLEIAPGEIWEAPLLLHANHPLKNEYDISLTATQDEADVGGAILKVKIEQPKLALEISWTEPETEIERARLVRRIKITNIGDNIPDLTVRFEKTGQAPENPIHLEPTIEKSWLHKDISVEVSVAPYIYTAFKKLEGTLVISGLGQEMRVPYLAEVPEGQGVFVTLSRTTSRSSNQGNRCTNSPRATYNLPPTNGTPSRGEWSESDGGFHVSDSNSHKPSPVSSEKPETPEEEKEDDESWSLFGPISDAPSEVADTEDKSEEATAENSNEVEKPDEETISSEPSKNPDIGSFDLMDANTEGLAGGLIEHSLKAEPKSSGEASDENKTGEKESTSFVDSDGKRTHMTRRPIEKGAEFVNFGWGMQGKGRRLGGRSVMTSGAAPQLGPNPRSNSPALLNFSEADEEGKTNIKTLDPETGKTSTLSDPTKNADSPTSLRTKDGVTTLFREDGVIRGVRVGENLTTSQSDGWPNGEKTGALISAKEAANGELALLTREDDGLIAYRSPNSTKTFSAKSAALGVTENTAHLALLDDKGSISIVDPVSGNTTHKVEGNGYTAPSVAKTVDGGLRMFFGKPMPERGSISEGDSGTELGGNFSIDYKDGAWEEPRRVFMPEEPVTDAVVAVEVSAPFAKAHYKKMDTDISFNGRKLQRIESEVPVGRYLYHVPTSALAYRSAAGQNGDKGNQVVINAKGIGPGNFHLTDKCSVYGRHEWTQNCLVATSGAEADRIAQESSPEMRHEAHDLILATNGALLPRSLTPGQKASLTLSAFNAGDLPSPAGEVTVRHEGFPVGKGKIPALKEFKGAPLELDFTVPPNWVPGTSLLLTVDAPTDGDADPSTNQLELPLLKELTEKIAGPAGPSRVDIASLSENTIVVVPKGEAYSAPLQQGRLWFRVPVSDTGELQLEVTGSGANGVDRVDLFDEKGQPISSVNGQWVPPGDKLYVRIGYPPAVKIPADTNLKIWWE